MPDLRSLWPAPLGRDRRQAVADLRVSEPPDGAGGAAGMWALTSIAVAFVVISAGVIALARSTTAHWERERGGVRDAGRRTVPSSRPPAGAHVRRALARIAATARPAAPARVVPRAVRQALARSAQRGAGRLPRVPQTELAEGDPSPRRRRRPPPAWRASADDGTVGGAPAGIPQNPPQARRARRRLTTIRRRERSTRRDRG